MSDKIKVEVVGEAYKDGSKEIAIIIDTDHGTYEEKVESTVYYSERAGRWYAQGHRGAVSQEQAQTMILQQVQQVVAEKFNPELASSIELEGEGSRGEVNFHGDY